MTNIFVYIYLKNKMTNIFVAYIDKCICHFRKPTDMPFFYVKTDKTSWFLSYFKGESG
ncbi:hypothetical protein SAMN05216233_108161 [Desulfoluna spongiiphila]|uniref:Uncharacterized protein n=1 Tax=Desulfoluna spongiiphila TaxID=419481 RepID=A0A1G5FMQ4_9BACT|nr:hypothetical protein SAMN05216233_108161 [Desulfoluna spongiiphila]